MATRLVWRSIPLGRGVSPALPRPALPRWAHVPPPPCVGPRAYIFIASKTTASLVASVSVIPSAWRGVEGTGSTSAAATLARRRSCISSDRGGPQAAAGCLAAFASALVEGEGEEGGWCGDGDVWGGAGR